MRFGIFRDPAASSSRGHGGAQTGQERKVLTGMPDQRRFTDSFGLAYTRADVDYDGFVPPVAALSRRIARPGCPQACVGQIVTTPVDDPLLTWTSGRTTHRQLMESRESCAIEVTFDVGERGAEPRPARKPRLNGFDPPVASSL